VGHAMRHYLNSGTQGTIPPPAGGKNFWRKTAVGKPGTFLSLKLPGLSTTNSVNFQPAWQRAIPRGIAAPLSPRRF